MTRAQARWEQVADELLVKLAAADVTARVADGRGNTLAPAGKVFQEWLALDALDESTWRAALGDALVFVRLD